MWRPRNPRGYPQNPWILERDLRETVARQTLSTETLSTETVSTTPKRARRVRRGQIQLTQAARAAATRERATRKERVGSELGHEDGVKEEGLSLRLSSVWSFGTPGCGRPSEGSVMSRDMSECMESSE